MTIGFAGLGIGRDHEIGLGHSRDPRYPEGPLNQRET